MLVVGEPGNVTPGDDPLLAPSAHQVLAQVVEPLADPPAAIVGVDHDVRAVVPAALRIVVAALVLSSDLDDPVLGMLEVEVEEDPGALPDDPVAVQAHEEALREGACVGAHVRLGDQLFGIRVGEAGELERGALWGEIRGQVHVPQIAHRRPTLRRSYSLSAGTPQTAQKSPGAGRMMAAPDDSMWWGGTGR